MPEKFKVSQSKVKTWRKCRQAYHYKYVDKLRKKRKSRPLQFGSIVHSMLEAEANADNPFGILDDISFENEKLFTAEKEMYGEIVKDIRTIMKAYFEYYKDDQLSFLRKKGKSAEHEFNIDILPDITFNGKIDAVVQTGNRLKWVEENKTFGKQLPDNDQRWRNLQSASYFRAIDMLGWWPNLSGVLWNYICSKPPSVPQVLAKTGKLSEKSINSLPIVIRRTLNRLDLDPKKHTKLMIDAKNNQKNYFQRIYTPINKKLVDFIFGGFIDTAKEMRDYHGKKQDMNIDKHCSWCDYEPLCRARLLGNDFDFIKEREYTHGTKNEGQDDESSERSE